MKTDRRRERPERSCSRTYLERGRPTGMLNVVLTNQAAEELARQEEAPKKKRRTTARQLQGLLLHRETQRSHLDAAIDGIRRKLYRMGALEF